MQAKAASAPGKVLLAGGYLVLDRAHTGLVFGLDARIHVHVAPAPADSPAQFVVISPQFRDTEWYYNGTLLPQNGGFKVNQALSSKNPFVQTVLDFALTYIHSTGADVSQALHIHILADESYYSQSSPSLSGSLGNRGRFKDFGVSFAEANKTGLGSSAALTTAFTAALLSFYLSPETAQLSAEGRQTRLHNLSQAAHCAAQGKVGSGFDVAAAVYGSCIYRRFSPVVLDNLGAAGQADFESILRSVVEDAEVEPRWDTLVDASLASISGGLRLLMCDVDCGSQTVGMVKKVLAWRKAEPDQAEEIWTRLSVKGKQLGELLRNASSRGEDRERLAAVIQDIRLAIRKMGAAAGVAIEPVSQTKLLDACTAISGIIGGVVPGAGGDDAIVLLIEDREDVLANLSELLGSWRIDRSSSGMGEGRVRTLNVRETRTGIIFEDSDGYQPWV